MSKRFMSKIIEGGRVTIPKRIRALNKLEKGDYVELIYQRKIVSPKGE